MRWSIMVPLLALGTAPLAAHANYYDARGGYHITLAPSSTIYTPQGVWSVVPNNPMQPNGGYTIYAPPNAASVPVIMTPPPVDNSTGPRVNTDAFMRDQQRQWEAKHCKVGIC